MNHDLFFRIVNTFGLVVIVAAALHLQDTVSTMKNDIAWIKLELKK